MFTAIDRDVLESPATGRSGQLKPLDALNLLAQLKKQYHDENQIEKKIMGHHGLRNRIEFSKCIGKGSLSRPGS